MTAINMIAILFPILGSQVLGSECRFIDLLDVQPSWHALGLLSSSYLYSVSEIKVNQGESRIAHCRFWNPGL